MIFGVVKNPEASLLQFAKDLKVPVGNFVFMKLSQFGFGDCGTSSEMKIEQRKKLKSEGFYVAEVISTDQVQIVASPQKETQPRKVRGAHQENKSISSMVIEWAARNHHKKDGRYINQSNYPHLHFVS